MKSPSASARSANVTHIDVAEAKLAVTYDNFYVFGFFFLIAADVPEETGKRDATARRRAPFASECRQHRTL
ncbi:unnamed protein product [Merluccius merluccius]